MSVDERDVNFAWLVRKVDDLLAARVAALTEWATATDAALSALADRLERVRDDVAALEAWRETLPERPLVVVPGPRAEWQPGDVIGTVTYAGRGQPLPYPDDDAGYCATCDGPCRNPEDRHEPAPLPAANRWWCPLCQDAVPVDEDECCSTCGATCEAVWRGEAQRRWDILHARKPALVADEPCPGCGAIGTLPTHAGDCPYIAYMHRVERWAAEYDAIRAAYPAGTGVHDVDAYYREDDAQPAPAVAPRDKLLAHWLRIWAHDAAINDKPGTAARMRAFADDLDGSGL